jgi:hypothetical protein
MEEQSGGEFASAYAAAGAQDAAVQESGFGAEISLHARRGLQHTFNVQRHLPSAQTHRALRAAAMDTWRIAVETA